MEGKRRREGRQDGEVENKGGSNHKAEAVKKEKRKKRKRRMEKKMISRSRIVNASPDSARAPRAVVWILV